MRIWNFKSIALAVILSAALASFAACRILCNKAERDIARLVSEADSRNFGDVAKRLSAYPEEQRNPLIIAGLQNPDFLLQHKSIALIAFFQIREAFPRLLDLFRQTDKDLIAYEIVSCLMSLNELSYSHQIMELLQSKAAISDKKKEYLISLASQYAVPDTLNILKQLLRERGMGAGIPASAALQMQKMNEAALMEEMGALFESGDDAGGQVLREVLMSLEVSPDATFLLNKFLLERSGAVDEKLLVSAFRLFDKDSVDILLVLGQEEGKRDMALSFMSRFARQGFTTVEDAKNWWKRADQRAFLPSLQPHPDK